MTRALLTLNERKLLERVTYARDPAFAPLVLSLGSSSLTETEREQLRSLLADELCERGLDPSDEPTEYGRALDSIIGKLMFY